MEGTAVMQWSVGIEVSGDEVLTLDRIGELAEAVAPAGGIASGVGQASYGEDRDSAVAKATEILRTAARVAALPEWPVSRVEAVSEADADDD